jgi:hypothetical protein
LNVARRCSCSFALYIILKAIVLADLEGKGRRIRTVAVPIWVKQGINAWMTAADIEDGRLLRSVSKSGKVNRDTLSCRVRNCLS